MKKNLLLVLFLLLAGSAQAQTQPQTMDWSAILVEKSQRDWAKSIPLSDFDHYLNTHYWGQATFLSDSPLCHGQGIGYVFTNIKPQDSSLSSWWVRVGNTNSCYYEFRLSDRGENIFVLPGQRKNPGKYIYLWPNLPPYTKVSP